MALVAVTTLAVVLAGCSSADQAAVDEPAGPVVVDRTDTASGSGNDEAAVDVDEGAAASEAAADSPEVTIDDGPTSMATLVLATPGPHLAVVVDEGGRCDPGPCRRVLELQLDGQWTFLDFDGSSQTGGYDAFELADLADALDESELVSGPFGGECPSESGGYERFYRVFSPNDGDNPVVDLTSCRHQLDAAAPIIVALDLLLVEASLEDS